MIIKQYLCYLLHKRKLKKENKFYMKKFKEKSNIMFLNIFLIIIYIILTVSVLVLFKLFTSQDFSIAFTSNKMSVVLNYKAILGLLCYVFSFLLYMGLVSKFDLSYIVPITQGIIYILIFISSIAIFKEKITIQAFIGTVMVILGIILLNIKK